MTKHIKMKDFVDECGRLGVTKLTMDFSGIGHAVADNLKEKGIEVNNSKHSIEQDLGSIRISAKGLRALAKSMDMIYYGASVLHVPIYRKGESNILFMQLGDGTGEIDLVNNIFTKEDSQ